MRDKDSLKKIALGVSRCHACGLYKNRHKTVPGEGNSKAQIFFIGEGPGKNEDLEGRPFVGAAGKFLEEMLGSIGLKRKDVFIGNIIKCRPPLNRDPETSEISACRPFLYRQLNIIRPKLIATLGRFSLGIFLPHESISRVHGKLKMISYKDPKRPLYPLNPLYLLPLYHPAAALYRGNMRQVLLDDFKNIPKIINKLSSPRQIIPPSAGLPAGHLTG